MRKIAIVGVEATGKSTLAEQLARHFQTLWVREYAREYLHNLKRKYTFDDVLAIAQGQQKLIEQTIAQNVHLPIIFIDTELLVTHIWCEYVFGKHHAWISEHLHKQNYDLYLLCDIDLPWEYDELREQPDLAKRKEIHALYLYYLQKLRFPYQIISGEGEVRLQNAIGAVNFRFFDRNFQK